MISSHTLYPHHYQGLLITLSQELKRGIKCAEQISTMSAFLPGLIESTSDLILSKITELQSAHELYQSRLKARKDKENEVLIPRPDLELNLFEQGEVDEDVFEQQAFPEAMQEEEPLPPPTLPTKNSAFEYYLIENRHTILQENPLFSYSEVSAKAAADFKLLKQAEKIKYVRMYLNEKADLDAVKKANRTKKNEKQLEKKASFTTFDSYLANLSQRNGQAPPSLFDQNQDLESLKVKPTDDDMQEEQKQPQEQAYPTPPPKTWGKDKTETQEKDKKGYQVLKSLFKKLQHP